MRGIIRLSLFAVLAFGCAGGALAGPLEEGVSAYNHADYATASRLLKPLGDKGNNDAQYILALMYLKGQGVPEDKVRAYLYFDLAARSGDQDAADERDKVASDMKPDQIEDAKHMAEEWKAK